MGLSNNGIVTKQHCTVRKRSPFKSTYKLPVCKTGVVGCI